MRLFDLELHFSVVQDAKNIIQTLFGNKVEVVIWYLSKKWQKQENTTETQVIRGENWKDFDAGMADRFCARFDSFLRTFDAFIVTHSPAFALIYERYNKPIIMINSCRYEQPYSFTQNFANWQWVDEGLERLQRKGLLVAVSNNRADQEYILAGANVASILIPSLCLYTKSSYNPTRREFVCFGNRSFFPPSDLLVSKPTNYEWKHLYEYKGIVHIPYEISTMSIFEQYSAGCPLWFPTRRYFKELVRSGSIHFQSRYAFLEGEYHKFRGKGIYPDHINKIASSIDFWIDRADFYDESNMKHVFFYDSPVDLIEKITWFSESSEARRERLEWIEQRKQSVYSAWQRLLEPIFFGRA